MAASSDDIDQGALTEAALMEVLDLAQSLLGGWRRSIQGRVEFSQPGMRTNPGRFVAIRSLAAHTHTSTATVVALLRAGDTLSAMPVVRLAFECALRSMWLALTDDAGEAFYNEFGRGRKAVAKTLSEAESEILRDGASSVYGAEVYRERLTSSSDEQAAKFFMMCHDLVGGADLYVYYRLMSEFCHPSLRIVEHYVEPNETFTDVGRLLVQPQPTDPFIWAKMATQSLVWAGTAVDYIEVTRRRRSELREAARSLGMDRGFKLTPEAQQRVATAQQQARRSQWRGKKSARSGGEPE